MKTEIVDLEEIHETIIAFANGDFNKRLSISANKDARDSIAAGINMLGEELEQTTISRNYFSSLYNAVSDMLIVTDSKGIIKDINKTALNKLKLNREDFIDTDAHILIPNYKEIIKAVTVNKVSSYHFETSLLSSLNEKIYLSCSISRITNKDNQNQGYLLIARDITLLKNQEQQLLNVMIATEEKERKRLAYDLHDSLGQQLNAIQMYLSSLNYRSSTDADFKKAFEECKNMLLQSIESVRNLSFDLMPKSLENGSLYFALEELTSKLSSICGFTFECDVNTQINKEDQITIYRVFQEFINNSLKHALPCLVNINIKEVSTNIIKFSIKDNGKGFNPKTQLDGSGIHNIKTRLKALGSSFIYNSKIGTGTHLEFTLNYENH